MFLVCSDAVEHCTVCDVEVCSSCSLGYFLYELLLANDDVNENKQCRGKFIVQFWFRFILVIIIFMGYPCNG